MGKRPPPPLWFVLLVGVLEALAWRWLVTSFDVAPAPGNELAPPLLGFWGAVLLVVGWIWTGVQVAGRITLQVLAYSVKVLWAFAGAVRNVVVSVGRAFVEFGHKAWDFLKLTYDQVLKPAWKQFWEWFDKARKWLDDTLGPVLNFLESVRTHILRFYERWVRPILDTIDIARRVLGILASLGLDWARELDKKLRWLEEKIDQPFRLVLGKLNEIIGVVNRVVTADGLFQRIAYIRTLQRDVRYVMNVWWHAAHREATDDERKSAEEEPETKTLREHVTETRALIRLHSGELSGRVNEEVADLKLQLRRP